MTSRASPPPSGPGLIDGLDSDMEIRERSGRSPSCPLCKEALDEGLDLHVCSSCNTTYHAVCSAELGGCATLGCHEQGVEVVLTADQGEFQLPPELVQELRAQVALEREDRDRRKEAESEREALKTIAFFLCVGLLLGGVGYKSSQTLPEQRSLTLLLSGLSIFIFVLTGKMILSVIKRPRS